MSGPFNEMSTLTDVELDDMIGDLRQHIKTLKNRTAGLISVQRSVFVAGRGNWTVAVVYDKEKSLAVAAVRQFLHEAMNDALDKIPSVPDLASIIGAKHE